MHKEEKEMARELQRESFTVVVVPYRWRELRGKERCSEKESAT